MPIDASRSLCLWNLINPQSERVAIGCRTFTLLSDTEELIAAVIDPVEEVPAGINLWEDV